MTDLVVPLLFIAILAVVLYGLVRSIDRADLRQRPEGLVSTRGLLIVVGGGFAFGFVWGLLTGWGSGPGVALLRALTVGLLASCAGALYLGAQQRSGKRRGHDD